MSDLKAGWSSVEKPQQCDLCGCIAELRPYGPKGETLCFDCATATPEMKASVQHQMDKFLNGEPYPDRQQSECNPLEREPRPSLQ